MNNELVGYLLGHATPALLKASFLFSFPAALVMLIYRISKRDKDSERTPMQWSWRFFWQDNWKQIFATIGFMILATRVLFCWHLQSEAVIGLSILIGLASDKLGMLFTKASDASVSLVNKKIDKVIDKVDSQDVKLNVVKTDVAEIKTDVKDIKENP